MKQLFLVGAGGFLGSVLRFSVSEWMARRYQDKFPAGTLAVNLIGCLLIGLLAGLAGRRNLLSPDVRLLIITGFLGGFTTFSAFGLDTVSLLRRGKSGLALLYLGVSVFGGLLLVWVGLRVAEPPSSTTPEPETSRQASP